MEENCVLVYGTLRTGEQAKRLTICGYKMFDLGWYPGVIYSGNIEDWIVCEMHRVDNATLHRLDSFEGYDEDDLDGSLYLRRNYGLDLTGCELYVYNRQVHEHPRIMGGDWLEHRGEAAGSNADLIRAIEEEYAL